MMLGHLHRLCNVEWKDVGEYCISKNVDGSGTDIFLRYDPEIFLDSLRKII
jgi:hypothetical protein